MKKGTSWTEVDKAVREVLSKQPRVRLRDLISRDVKEHLREKEDPSLRVIRALDQIQNRSLPVQQRKDAFTRYIISKSARGEL